MSEQVENNKPKVSALSEFSALSAGIIVAVVIFAIVSVFAYAFMTQPPKKMVDIEDKAGLLSKEEESDLLKRAKKIRSDKQINIIIVTTDDKGSKYDYGDEGSKEFAIDKYNDLAKTIPFKDNSGIIFLIDMENRYMYIYTYATAHAVIPDEECTAMFESVQSMLTGEEYAEALDSLLDQVEDRNFVSGAFLIYILYIVGPLAITALVVFTVLHRKRNKITVNQTTYLDPAASAENEDQDIFLRKTTSITYASSGSGISGGGFRGGGGGGFGGGGGRGGGGGGHF